MSMFGKPPVFDWATEKPDWHFEVTLTPLQRQLLLRIIGHESPRVTIKEREFLLALVKNARRHDGAPLPDAALDWRELEAEARRQGCDAADILWDRAKGREPA